MEPIYNQGGISIYHADALDLYTSLDDSSFGLIWLDPPYYKRKRAAWDNQWDTLDKYLAWLGEHADQWARLLAANGSLYCCADHRWAWEVEGVLRERFNIVNRITWEKDAGWHQKAKKEDLRSYTDPIEIVFFCEHYGADNYAKGEAGYDAKCDELRGFVFEPLRQYIRAEWKRAGLTRRDMNEAVGSSISGGGMASHYIGDTGQWALPTQEHYQSLRAYANSHNSGGQYLRREYEDLRREYEDLRREYEDLRREYEDLRREYEDLRREYEDLRRPFNATPERPFTSVWHYATVAPYDGKHPAEKPLDMVRDVILTSSRNDTRCADFFCGSGVFGEACRALGRECVLCDQSERWARRAVERVSGAQLVSHAEHRQTTDSITELPLFSQMS